MRRRRGRRYDDTPKLNIKKVIATIIAFVVFIMFCGSLKNLLNNDEKSVQEKVAQTTYVSIYENNKWGVIDQKGEIIITPTYEEMIIIPEKHTGLFVCTYNVNYDNETYETKILNAEEKEILTEYENIEVLQNTDGTNIWYEKDVLRFKRNDKYGLIDFEGKEILPAEYDKIYVLEGIEKSIIVEKDGKKGLFLSSTGEMLIAPEYLEITALTNNYENGYIVKNQDEKCGVISINKKTVLKEEYDAIKNIIGNGYYVVVKDKKEIIIDSQEKIVLDKGFDSVEKIDSENFIIIKNNKYGIISSEGTEIIPFEYEDIKPAIIGEYYIAKKDGKYGVIGEDNIAKINFIYDNMKYIKEADFIEAERSDYKTDIIDANLKVALENIIISEMNIESGYIRVRKDNNYKYYNFKFEEKSNIDVLSTNTLFLFRENGKYGYTNKDGEIIVDPIYDDAKEQNELGYCAVKKGNVWGSLKSDGTIVLAPSVNLDEYVHIDFIGKWHRSNSLNTYIK